jgi:hypothetical protein
MIDRKLFFGNVRASFGRLSQSQVDGFALILDTWDLQKTMSDQRWLAYMLATVWHETAKTMQPIEEYGKGRGRVYGPTGFWGRGYVQLTWEANYLKAGQKLGVDMVANPDLALKPNFAVKILFYGMRDGWFTGKKLADYFSATVNDPVSARRIINGTDRAALIADYHAKFLADIKASTRGQTPPDVPRPVPPASGGFIAALINRLASIFRKR